MKVVKYVLPMLVALGVSFSIYASSNDDPLGNSTGALDVVNEKDTWAVRDWLKSKRVALNNKGGDLSVSGEVRTEWRNVHEKLNGVRQVGINSVSGLANNQFDVEVNLYFDYKADKTWAAIKLEFDNAMGRLTGDVNQIALERAYLGYHLFDDGVSRLDLMVGRQRMYDLYDSEIQFNSTADGFTATYAVSFESVGDFLVKGGGYLVDARQAHPVWIIEAGIFDIGDTGLYFEYSFVDWSKNGNPNLSSRNVNAFKFINNQFILGYVFDPAMVYVDARFFGGILWNADADKRALKRLTGVNTRANLGWWIALQVGKLEKAMDWAGQVQWQVSEAQAVPDFDVSGIGRGNSQNSAFFTTGPGSTTVNVFPGQLAQGDSNYSGFEIDFMYALTNEIVLEARLQRALAKSRSLGGPLSYTNFQLEAIYGF